MKNIFQFLNPLASLTAKSDNALIFLAL